MKVEEKLRIIEKYIKLMKGVDVKITPPTTMNQTMLMDKAYGYASAFSR